MTITNRVSLKSVEFGVTSIDDVVDAPTIGTATNVGTSRAFNNGAATVAFTPAVTGGAATTYTAVSTPGSFTGSGSSSPVTVAGLQSSTSYTFKVYGNNASGNWSAVQSGSSNSITATTVPQAPTIGTVTDGGTGTTVSIPYTANATGGSAITNYQFVSNPATTTQTSTSNPYTFTGLTAGTAYTFTVAAINANGTSAASSASNSVTPVVPTAFDSIATFTGDNTTTTYTFSSIPGTYKALQIRFIGIGAGGGLGIRFNGDTGANYTRHYVEGYNSSMSAGNNTSASNISFTASLGMQGTSFPYVSTIDIADYASTSKTKTTLITAGTDANLIGASGLLMVSGLWNSTSAINSITIYNTSQNFASGTRIALYGVK